MRIGRRTATLAAVAAVSAYALVTSGGSASADDIVPISVGHWVGLYNDPNTTDGKIGWYRTGNAYVFAGYADGNARTVDPDPSIVLDLS